MFLIKRTDQGGGYVAKPGLKSSYTFDLRKVRKFDTEEEAKHAACTGNEIVVPFKDI